VTPAVHRPAENPDGWEAVWGVIASAAANRRLTWPLLGVLTSLVFAITFRDSFGSDDFTLLAWARTAPLRDLLATFEVWKPRHLGPLLYLVFYLQYRIFGVAAWGYRLVSIDLHVIAVILVYEICRRLLHRPLVALLAALSFAWQPAHSQAVMWDAAVDHVISSTSYLAALLLFLAYLDTHRRVFLGITLLAVVLSMLAKDESLTLPPILFLSEFLLFDRRLTVERLAKYAPLIALFVPYLLARSGYYLLVRSTLPYGLGWHMPGKLWDYATSLALPLPVHFADRVTQQAPWFGLLRRLAAIGTLLGLTSAALLGRARDAAREPFRRRRLVAFVLAWGMMSTLPFLPFTYGISPRYAYLPAVPFSILSALAFQSVWRATPGRRARLGIVVLASAVLVFYAGSTLYNERDSYFTGLLCADLMQRVEESAPQIEPGTRILLVDSPLAAQSARPIFHFSHAPSVGNLQAIVNVTRDSPEYRAAESDAAALVFVYEGGKFRRQ